MVSDVWRACSEAADVDVNLETKIDITCTSRAAPVLHQARRRFCDMKATTLITVLVPVVALWISAVVFFARTLE